MGDPFSIASGVAGIVSLGFTLCGGLHTYLSAVKDRCEDVATASQHLIVLRSSIELIQSSASTLSSRYPRATQGVILALGACQHELQALGNSVQHLTDDKDSSRWQRPKTAAMYPFNRKKLIETQDQLFRTMATLRTFVEVLILNVNVGLGEDIEAFRLAVKDNSIKLQASLDGIDDRLDLIGPSVEETKTRLTTISARVEDQSVIMSTNHTLLHDVHTQISHMSSRIERVCDLHDATQSRTGGLTVRERNINNERARSSRFNTTDCECSSWSKRARYQRSQTSFRLWGGLSFLKEEESVRQHHPECSLYNERLVTRRTKTSLTYTGFRVLLSRVLTASLHQEYRAGTFFFTAGLRTYNIVENSPAFDLVKQLTRDSRKCPMSFDTNRLRHELRLLYTSRSASPLDVDVRGQNVAVQLCEAFYWTPENASELITIFRLFMDLGMEVNALDFKEPFSRLYNEIEETDFCGNNVLHLSSAWPTGLQLLLAHQTTHVLLNEPNNFEMRPVDYALNESGKTCDSQNKFTPCHNCDCCASLQIILDMDCSLMFGVPQGFLLSEASLKGRTLYLQHLKDRRSRLQEMALACLPVTQQAALGLTTETLPDKMAPQIWHELYKRDSNINPALQVLDHNRYGINLSAFDPFHLFEGVFFSIQCPIIAEEAFAIGFQSIDDSNGRGLTPLMGFSTIFFFYPAEIENYLLYADWLLQKGARADYANSSFGTTAAHHLAHSFGEWVGWHMVNLGKPPDLELVNLSLVLSTIFSNNTRAFLTCHCVSGGAARPLQLVIAAAFEYFTRGFTSPQLRNTSMLLHFLLDIFDERDEETLVRDIIYSATFRALDMRHFPGCYRLAYHWSEEEVQDPGWKQELEEISEEDRHLTKQLEKLTEECHEEFLRQKVPFEDFLRGYWRPRMREVRKARKKAWSEDERQSLLEAGVIVRESANNDSDSDDSFSDDSEDEEEFQDADEDLKEN
ncbi:hypothetical protein FZEAL_7650 [Fusarium zealandicum]|uniref:Fungal N-terminal domain-containing protein n=1 Tax=Fusarium zealandicum TaxID=1053134 RepID=A0A8H4XIA5_9HYPO|nr:hypothetical protein FZEAL_7650 [Fusarium zealandicum]